MATCDVQALMDSSACWNGLTGQQLRVVQTQILAQILLTNDAGADVTPETLLESGKCFAALDSGLLNVVIAQLLCEIINV